MFSGASISPGSFILCLLPFCCCAQLPEYGKSKILSGKIAVPGYRPSPASTIYLLFLNPATGERIKADSSVTDASGFYSITTKITGRVYLVAVPENEMHLLPTYFNSALTLQQATSVNLSSGVDQENLDISLYQISGGGGNGVIGGFLRRGASIKGDEKENMNGVPLLLVDEEKKASGYWLAEYNGRFVFRGLPPGVYQVWIDFPGVNNEAGPFIRLSPENSYKDSLSFEMEKDYLECLNAKYTGITDALKTPDKVYELHLNSLRFDVQAMSLSYPSGDGVTLHPGLSELLNLEYLSADFNQLTEIPKAIARLTKLETLSLSYNRIASLPDELGRLQHLRVLLLGKNLFTVFPEPVTKLKTLEELNLKINKIPALPASIGNLRKLKILNISSNFELQQLPESIGQLQDLEHLNLANCVSLNDLPDAVFELKKLKYINLDYTGVSKKTEKKLREVFPDCVVQFARE